MFSHKQLVCDSMSLCQKEQRRCHGRWRRVSMFFLEQESLHGWQGRAAPVRAHVCSWPVEELHSGVGAVGPTRTRPTHQTLQLPSGSASRLPDIEVKLQRTQANLAVRRPQASSLRSRCKRIVVGTAADVASGGARLRF